MAISEVVSKLDSYQQAAVDHAGGPAIVLAGPGSGKTRVIVERAVRLIDDGLARPDQLLVLTFSRKAASDLRERLAGRLRRSYATFPVTTFHSFCFSLLAGAGIEVELAHEPQRRRLAAQALAEHGNLGLPASRTLTDEALAFCGLCDDYLEVTDNALAPVRERYVELLAEEGLHDYGALQREAVALLAKGVELPSRYVLVDEFQDTNVAQERLLELIAGEHRNVFCVADEDQSIYGFRGAEIENAMSFESRWPGATRYDLPTNYRSAPRIVELATSVIRRNVETHRDKPLAAAEDRPAEPRGRVFRHPAEETDWIAREIAGLRLDGVPLGQIAILARSVRELGPRLAYALRSHGIPFHAPLAPPLQPTVEGLLSLSELAPAYPWEPGHNEQALRTLASPLFGADPLELRAFRRTKRTMYGELKASGRFDPFFEALAIVKRQHSAGNAVYALWDRLDYFRDLQARCRHDAAQDDVEELEAVTALSDAANDWEGELADFPEAFRSGQLAHEDWLPASSLPHDAVALLTVHQAKGLEWDAVFVADLVEGRFPALARSRHSLFDREDFARATSPALEEERRLFYVAVTRARTQLYLSATEESKEETGRALSRFYLEAQGFLDAHRERDGFVSAEEALAALRRAGGGPPGWRERAETKSANAMLPDGRFWTSATRLAPYENCPLQFFLGGLLDIRGPRTAAMTLGGIFHDVAEAFHDPKRNEPQTRERLLELGAEKWSDEGMKPEALAAQNKRVLTKMLEDYYDHEVAPGLVGDVLAVEQRFSFELEQTTVSGYIDRIDRLEDGRLRLLDYKTSKQAMPLVEAEQDLQLALYALACGEVPELAELGEVAEILYLYPRDAGARGLKRRSQTVTHDLVDETRERILKAIASMVHEEFDFSPEADCKWCDFKRVCPRHHGRDVPL